MNIFCNTFKLYPFQHFGTFERIFIMFIQKCYSV